MLMQSESISFEKANILVVGDIMLDRYVWGKVSRISPEAPVPVVTQQRTTETLGGAGNVANNLAALGCRVTVLGVCGDDETAMAFKGLLAGKSITDNIVVDPARPTTTKTRIMAHKQQVLRLDAEDVQPLSRDIEKQVAALFVDAITRCQVIVLSDYGKGIFSTRSVAQDMIRLAGQYNRPILVDPKGNAWERYQGATCVTPNTLELETVAGEALAEDEGHLILRAREIRNRYGLHWLLVTRGPQGMCLLGPRENQAYKDREVLIPARAREVYDVSGAGDTVIATLAAALAVGASFVEAAEMANLAAGIVVGKLGTQPILRSELVTALRFSNDDGRYFPYSVAKMTGRDAALARVHQWKSAGERVVFTNGCFDLLHPGHISLLHQARSLGDRLVVGLNTDASVRRLKGPERPILSEQDRAAILGALECVDLVVHFDENTPVELIAHLQPDILVKGSDYTLEQVVGRELVESYGGSVRLVELLQGYSTTRLAFKMRANSDSGHQEGTDPSTK